MCREPSFATLSYKVLYLKYMADINLLSQEDKGYESFDALRKKLSVFSVILLVVSAVATLGTLAFYTSLVSGRDKIIIRVEDASAKVNSYKNVEELAVVTKEKAQVASGVIASRSDHVKLFNALSQFVPQNVSFTNIKVAQGKIVLSGSAKTSADIAGFISALTSTQGAEMFSGVSVDSLGSDEQGVYTFGISATLIK